MKKTFALVLAATTFASCRNQEKPRIANLAHASLDSEGVQEATTRAMNACGAPEQTTEARLEAALRLINIQNYTHTYEQAGSADAPPPPPKGGTHPYEWDSLRTVDQMLANRDGGSCGTHGLSIAAISRGAGVPESDIYVVGAVQAPDYREICPAQGRPHAFSAKGGAVHPANGHVFLLVKLASGWSLFNSTHNPDQAFEARRDANAMCKFGLADFEKIPFQSPEELRTAFTSELPTKVPVDSFPSLVQWMQSPDGSLPPMLIFALWTLEEYPVHTIKDRLDLVASGKMGNSTCRWTLPEGPGQSQPEATEPSGAIPTQPPTGAAGGTTDYVYGTDVKICKVPSAQTVKECYCADGGVDEACVQGLGG